MRKERKILRFVPQNLRKSFANGNPSIDSRRNDVFFALLCLQSIPGSASFGLIHSFSEIYVMSQRTIIMLSIFTAIVITALKKKTIYFSALFD